MNGVQRPAQPAEAQPAEAQSAEAQSAEAMRSVDGASEQAVLPTQGGSSSTARPTASSVVAKGKTSVEEVSSVAVRSGGGGAEGPAQAAALDHLAATPSAASTGLAALHASRSPRVTRSKPVRRGVRALVVEHDAELAQQIVDALRARGIQAEAVGSSGDVERYLGNHDLLWIGTGLADASVLEVVKKAVVQPKPPQIVMALGGGRGPGGQSGGAGQGDHCGEECARLPHDLIEVALLPPAETQQELHQAVEQVLVTLGTRMRAKLRSELRRCFEEIARHLRALDLQGATEATRVALARRALSLSSGNVADAARRLGVSKQTLYTLLKNSGDVGVRNAGSLAAAYRLTRREEDVLSLVLSGVARRDLSRSLGISDNSVKSLVRGLLRKTACANLSDLLRKLQYDVMPGSEAR